MAKETLIQKFAKNHFTNSPAHLLRSVNMGEFLFKYFLPDAEMPKDPATLLNVTRQVMLANEQHLSDKDFVRMMLVQIDQDPSLITFDMVADLVESDAYKKFGTKAGSQDADLKNTFEHWLFFQSTLSSAANGLTDSVDIVLNKDGISRILNAYESKPVSHITPGGVHPDINGYRTMVNNAVDAFNDFFVNNSGDDAVDRIFEINNDNPHEDFATKLKNIYGVLGGQQYGEALGARVDAVTAGQDSKTRNTLLEGEALYLNKVLLGVAQQKGWSDDKIGAVLVSTPVERRAEQFAHEDKNFHPVVDVVKTFGLTLGGATAISTITAIPGVGSVVGPLLGLTTVIGAGTTSFLKSLKQSKAQAQANGEKLKKADAAKIALKTGIAMMGKALPYAASMALGPKFRAVGAGIVMAQTMLNDLNRRADLQLATVEEYEAQQGKPKNIFTRIANVANAVKEKRLKGSDFVKAATYGAAKGAAVYLGGQIGRDLGSTLGHKIDPAQIKASLVNGRVGKLVSSFNGLHHEVENHYENETSSSDKLSKVNVAGLGNDSSLHANQLSDDNLDRLSKIGRVELTEHARMTADVNAHPGRQYVGGARENWYNFEQQQNAIHTLHDAGVEDAEGVLRKIGSLARFESAGEIEKGGYQDTLNHLKAGSINNRDVDNLFQALARINEEGGLGRGYTVPTPVPTPAPAPVEIPTFESVSTDPIPELVTEPSPEPTPSPEPVEIPDFTYGDDAANETVIDSAYSEPDLVTEPTPEPVAIPTFVDSENATDEISLDAPAEMISNDIAEAANVSPLAIPGFAHENGAVVDPVTDSSAVIPTTGVDTDTVANPTATPIPAFENGNNGANVTSASGTVDNMRTKFYNAYNVDIELLKQLNETSAASSDNNLTNRIFGYSDLFQGK